MSIHRILVALDASPHSLAALEAAASLAARLQAELLGLFVEDINLLHLASLPFAREFGFPSAISRPLDARAVECMLRASAQQARQAFAEAAEKRGVRWSFRVARGSVVAELLRAAAEIDLLALGIAGRDLTSRTRLGSTALSILASAPANLLLLQHGAQIKARALLVLDCSRAALQTLPTALDLANLADGPLSLLILADEPDQAQQRLEEIAPALEARGLQARIQTASTQNLAALIRMVEDENVGTVIFAAESALLESPQLQATVQALSCPVFLIRQPVLS